MLQRNNPTSNRLQSQIGKTSGIKPSRGKMSDMNILCMTNTCTTFDKDGKTVKRVLMLHEPRNELYRCPNCNKVVTERELRYVISADLPDYVYYDEKSPKNINEIDTEREQLERYMVKPINAESPMDRGKKRAVRVIK